MTMIRLPRAAAKLKAFIEFETETHGRALEIRQTDRGAVIAAGDGRQLCRIVAPAPAGMQATPVDPFLIDARDFAKAAAAVGCSRTTALATADPSRPAAADRPLIVARVDDKHAAIAGPEGQPQTVKIPVGTMPNAAGIIDRIQGEAASGMTKAVGRVNPRYLQSLADTAVAMGIERIEFTFAPRWNFLLAEGTAPDGCEVAIAIAGIGDVPFEAMPSPPPPTPTGGVLVFTMPATSKPRSSSRRTAKVKQPEALPLSFEDDLPF